VRFQLTRLSFRHI